MTKIELLNFIIIYYLHFLHFLQFDSFQEMGKDLSIRLWQNGENPEVDEDDDGFTPIFGIYRHLRYNGEQQYSWHDFKEALKSALDNGDWETIPILSAVLTHAVDNYFGNGKDGKPFDSVEIQYD